MKKINIEYIQWLSLSDDDKNKLWSILYNLEDRIEALEKFLKI